MKNRNIWMGIALLLSVLLLATCGGDSGTTPTPAPTPAPVPAPTPAPAPEPEADSGMRTYDIEYTLNITSIPIFAEVGLVPHREVAFVAHPLDDNLWEEGEKASDELEHLAFDGHASDLTSKASQMGWPVLARTFEEVLGLLTGGGLPLSEEFPCLSYAQRIEPSPDWVIGFNVCAIHDHEGELHWEETFEIRAEIYDAGVRDGEPYTRATGRTDPREDISRVMTPPWDTEAVLEATATLQEE